MGRVLTKKEWRRRKRRKHKLLELTVISLMIAILIFAGFIFIRVMHINLLRGNHPETVSEALLGGRTIQQEYLTPNKYSRPRTKLWKVDGIVVHYTANPGTSAEENRNYFNGLAVNKTTYASSHYIIGLEGEIVQCIPLTEVSYASNDRNKDTVAIECCHPDETGKFNKATYNSLVTLTAALCSEYNLGKEDVIRHYDVTGKLCPLYYVKHESEWNRFKEDVMAEKSQIEDRTDHKGLTSEIINMKKEIGKIFS